MEETRRHELTREKQEVDALSLEVELANYAFGMAKTAVVKCAIELGIAEAIENHGSAMTISELSSTLKCDPSLLQRIMRFLVHQRIFKQKPTSQGSIAFEQTPISRRLMMRHGENSLAAFILIHSSSASVASLQSLSAHVLANGTSAFNMAHGKDMWSYIESDASISNLFNESVVCTTRMAVSAITEGCPEVFDGVATLVEVGRSNGTALSMLVKAFPWIKGINFDLPQVVNVVEKCHGVEHIGGNIFKCIPKADAILLKRFFHMWGDDECIQILKNCREAIPKDKGKVIIFDTIIEEDESEDKLKSEKLLFDIVTMAHCNKGKVRTLKEWDYILRQAGLDRYNIKSVAALQSLIEAFPN